MKILIVDDEIQIRTGLEIGVPWDSLGISQVFIAENGIEALTICEKEKPQIVITDIRMPEISGLELGKKIKELYKPVEVIILSGYSEFEYAKKALELGAFDYLLKPIRIKELMECVQKTKEKIEKFYLEMKQQSTVSELVGTYEILKLLKKNEVLEKKEIEVFQNYSFIEFKDEVRVGICDYDQIKEKLDYGTQKLLDGKVDELLEKCKSSKIRLKSGKYAFIINVISDFDVERKSIIFQDELKKLNEILEKEIDNTISMAISKKGKPEEIPQLFAEAEKLIKKRMYIGKKAFIETDQDEQEVKIKLNPLDVMKVKKRIEHLDYEHIHLYFKEVFLNLKDQKIDSEDFVRSICEQLKSILFCSMLEEGIDIEGICENNQEFLNDIPKYLTIDEYEHWIDTFYEMIIQGLSALSGKQHSRAILKAVDYISQNYSKNINLEMTAEYVNKSKNYFSYLFKKELGVSFVEYLNIVRIGEAKKILDTTDDKTYEIAEKVGFSDYKYFSSVFKKIVGVSPSKYKKGEWNE